MYSRSFLMWFLEKFFERFVPQHTWRVISKHFLKYRKIVFYCRAYVHRTYSKQLSHIPKHGVINLKSINLLFYCLILKSSRVILFQVKINSTFFFLSHISLLFKCLGLNHVIFCRFEPLVKWVWLHPLIHCGREIWSICSLSSLCCVIFNCCELTTWYSQITGPVWFIQGLVCMCVSECVEFINQ